MTFLGKIFVMCNAAVSLLMAFLAFGLYANSVEWGFDASKPGQPGGILKDKQDQIKEIQSTQAAVDNSWKIARAKLWAVEGDLRDDRAFYSGEMEHLREKAKEGDPSRVVVLVNSLAVRDKANKGRPQMKVATIPALKQGDPDEELYGRKYYDDKFKEHHTKNLQHLTELRKETIKHTILLHKALDVFQINKMYDEAAMALKAEGDMALDEEKRANAIGDKDKISQAETKKKLVEEKRKDLEATQEEVKLRVGGKSSDNQEPIGLRGLQTLLVDERLKRENLEEELRRMRPLYVNTAVEAELILKRLAELNKRIAELDAYIKKRNLDANLVRK